MKIKFFAWLKESLGEEVVIEHTTPLTVLELKNKLISEHGEKFAVLNNPSILVSVNLEFAENDTVVKNLDEVAFFPPVTGG
ncbi:MAG: MoaD/ThiS family protein [Alphaproteobacteria bacterium]|jgi:molybdopterin synthase sulfur carrier subunit|nr:MoaD/ThiS family protein [Alphaproteobacteria bacterium]